MFFVFVLTSVSLCQKRFGLDRHSEETATAVTHLPFLARLSDYHESNKKPPLMMVSPSRVCGDMMTMCYTCGDESLFLYQHFDTRDIGAHSALGKANCVASLNSRTSLIQELHKFLTSGVVGYDHQLGCTLVSHTMTTVSLHQEEVVTKFAALLGTKRLKNDSIASSTMNSDPVRATSRELMLCLSKGIEQHGVICTLPSLDMRKIDEDAGTSPLPKVGQHFHTEAMSADSASAGGDKAVPQMEASVLNSAVDASAKAAHVEQKAAQSLGSLTSWTKSSVVYAPSAISNNVADSFSSLVDSRVRAWTLLLLRHSLTTGDSASRTRLLSMLASIVKIDSAMTTFKTLPLPESAANQPKNVDVVLPLLLEVDLQISIQKKNDSVTLRAPGTISGMHPKRMFEECQLLCFTSPLLIKLVLSLFLIIQLILSAPQTAILGLGWYPLIFDWIPGRCLIQWYSRQEW